MRFLITLRDSRTAISVWYRNDSESFPTFKKKAHLCVCWDGTSVLQRKQNLVRRGDMRTVSPRCGNGCAASDGSTFWKLWSTSCIWRRGRIRFRKNYFSFQVILMQHGWEQSVRGCKFKTNSARRNYLPSPEEPAGKTKPFFLVCFVAEIKCLQGESQSLEQWATIEQVRMKTAAAIALCFWRFLLFEAIHTSDPLTSVFLMFYSFYSLWKRNLNSD